MALRVPKQFGLCLLLTFVSKLTFGENAGEICNYALDTCLKYDGYHARKFQSAVNHCQDKGEQLLEILSTEMLDFVDNFFGYHMSKYFPDGEGFNSFVHLGQLQSKDVFIGRGLEVVEQEMGETDPVCTRIKLKSSWTLSNCPLEAWTPVVCSKKAAEKLIFPQCIPAYLTYISLLVFGIGLVILFAVVVFGFKREIKLRKRRRRQYNCEKEQNVLNPDFYEEIGQRSDLSYMTVNNNVQEVNVYHTLGTAETIVEDASSGTLTSGL